MMKMNKFVKENICEILAPAGSYQCMIAAFNAGADAVYVGGTMFGARAFANNFNDDELISAINYAHLHGKKLYLTVNTLLKQKEIDEQLINYLKPFYEAGLDAVIVQDIGVLNIIHSHFPDLAIHASTQMTVTGIYFAKKLKDMGVTRIVTARELSFGEIKAIYDATGLEIESVVHGALCYSYSGQCLLSSMIGGRSGNRGRCAQPCRLPYDLYYGDKKINDKNSRYILSPKDMCTLEILPEILACGVYSLKIEGRMKKPEYVASVVSIYKKYVSLIGEEKKYKISEDDINILKDIYNRGGFTDGYYNRQNSRSMMSLYKPNHYGLKVADIIGFAKKNLICKAVGDINENDILEVNLKNGKSFEVKTDKNVKRNDTFNILCSKINNSDLYEASVFRTRNNTLIDEIAEKYIDNKQSVLIEGSITIKENMPMELTISMNDGASYTAIGSVPEKATKRAATEDDVKKQILKTGGSDFKFKNLDIILDEGLFLPVSSLNELRREAIEGIENIIADKYKRTYNPLSKENVICSEHYTDIQSEEHRKTKYDCIVSNIQQLNTVLTYEFTSGQMCIDSIGLELSAFSYEKLSELADYIHKKGKLVYIALPYICRNKAIADFKATDFFTKAAYDGLIIRNYEEYYYFKDMVSDKEMIFDSSVYMFNRESIGFLKNNISENFIYTLPYELNFKELQEIEINGGRMEIYGYIPVMTSAGCVKKTFNLCDKQSDDKYYLKDRMGNKLYVVNNCKYCYNTILNPVPLYLGQDIETIKKINIKNLSIRFTIENQSEVENVLKHIEDDLRETSRENTKIDFTRGHFRRGVD